MKKFAIALLAATVLAAPMAQAQEGRHHQDRSRHVERHVEKKVTKKVVVHKHRWAKGHRMSAAERRRMADVRDYRRYRLSAPPRGYKWVKVDNDFLMIAAATGIISSVIVAR
jgi:Ni/Co efflux regulator RcnB